MIIDWYVHSAEAERIDPYPHQADVHRQFRDPLEAKFRMLHDLKPTCLSGTAARLLGH
jgi:hypothetical protein